MGGCPKDGTALCEVKTSNRLPVLVEEIKQAYGVGYCLTREALLRLCGGLESPVDPSALLILAALPEHITVAHHG